MKEHKELYPPFLKDMEKRKIRCQDKYLGDELEVRRLPKYLQRQGCLGSFHVNQLISSEQG